MIPSLFYWFKIGNPPIVKLHLHSTSIFASISIVRLLILLIFNILHLQKFSDEEWANMPTCNFVEIIHNIKLQ